jgi:transcriptional regulator with XRE-family HTH domain
MDWTKFRIYRTKGLKKIPLDDVARLTGLSIGYLNRIERGYIGDIKDKTKKQNFIKLYKTLQRQYKAHTKRQERIDRFVKLMR